MRAEQQIASECLATRIRRLNRIVSSIYDEALRPFGVKISQLNILVATATHERSRPADLCRTLDLDPSTLSRNLRILHRRGWIEYLEDQGDARAQPFRLTAAAEELIVRAYPAWLTAQLRAEEALGPEAAAVLRRTWPEA